LAGRGTAREIIAAGRLADRRGLVQLSQNLRELAILRRAASRERDERGPDMITRAEAIQEAR